ncbi:hypothetical protein AVEN_212719-1 [Araneus ventricosus]|uniref:Uncharacterized protein n=1 Tax=Araneus ventricosus TaxID=182803 RepID=A0A4Y2JJW7_ARAVE|nr:hypothetical protein AVEN_212719-1 [Araneus ventricosus]
MESRNKGEEAVSLYTSYLAEICFWRTQYTAYALKFRHKKKQIVPPDCYLLVLQEHSDEEKAYDYINTSNIVDKEHIDKNYLSNSENEVNDLKTLRVY